jgi:hypothetical protein
LVVASACFWFADGQEYRTTCARSFVSPARNAAGINSQMVLIIDGTKYPSPREKSLISAQEFSGTLHRCATDGTLGDVGARYFG